MRPAISDDEADVPGAERVRVLALEECRRFDNLRRNLDDVGSCDSAGAERGFEGHAAAEPDDTDVAWTIVHQHRQESEEALSEHVAAPAIQPPAPASSPIKPVTRNVVCRPIAGRSTKPAVSAPAIAPSVLNA